MMTCRLRGAVGADGGDAFEVKLYGVCRWPQARTWVTVTVTGRARLQQYKNGKKCWKKYIQVYNEEADTIQFSYPPTPTPLPLPLPPRCPRSICRLHQNGSISPLYDEKAIPSFLSVDSKTLALPPCSSSEGGEEGAGDSCTATARNI